MAWPRPRPAPASRSTPSCPVPLTPKASRSTSSRSWHTTRTRLRADAVALYRSSPGRTYASVAQDLGVNHETLRVWVREAEQVTDGREAKRVRADRWRRWRQVSVPVVHRTPRPHREGPARGRTVHRPGHHPSRPHPDPHGRHQLPHHQ
ncbi:transposase [Micromonospora sp. CPCC 206060]|uniref:transposase n=1 Tax=Micromonospora sp. CPCC 206060 TaxID=3122406 RepID=UPI003FA55298